MATKTDSEVVYIEKAGSMTSQINNSELQQLVVTMSLSFFILERNTLKIINSLNAHLIFPEVINGNEATDFNDLIEGCCIPEDIDMVKEDLLLFKSGQKHCWAGVFRIRKSEKHSVWVYMKIYRSDESAIELPNRAVCVIMELDPAGINKEQLNVFTAEIKKAGNAEKIKKLTPREIEIIRLIAQGYSYTGIAEMLNIHPDTVNRHRKNILKKLGLSNIAMMICFAKEVGLI